MYQAAYRNSEYRQQEVMGASPVRLVVMAYDMAIMACEQKDFEKAAKVISALRDALDFEYTEVSGGLFRVYQWCLDCLRAGDFDGAKNNLKELRNAWVIAEKQQFTAAAASRAAARPSLAQVAG
jgi:flagellin-specific chaperone FliS